ncbi:MAG: pyridoxal phosphate-dependent aminotransferase [Bacteroidetes bacterium]|nr:MAG: pyridoxal phosphate-dependent aminotransferase [Bacteroidota bacterium]
MTQKDTAAALRSKLPQTQTTIFAVMSALAQKHGAINLSQGFPDFDCPEELKALVAEHMHRGHNQYAPMTGVPALREAIARKIGHCYGIEVDPQHEITVTAGATQALFCAITAFVHPGDEVLLFEPAYDSYRPAVRLNGGTPVPLQLQAPDYRIDWERFEGLLSPRTRLVVLNHPHNPVGRCLQREDLLTLESLAEKHDLLILSDEVYEHLIYDGGEHHSVLRFEGLRRRSLATFSFGKTFHNTGWKVGYCIAPPPLMDEFRKVHQFNVFSVNTPIQYALADYLSDPAVYESLPQFYQAKRDFFNARMQGARLRPLPCEGTYFQLFDYSAISDEPDTEFAKRLTREHGVAAIPVSVFNSSGHDDRVIRLCFAKKEETLERAAERLRGV